MLIKNTPQFRKFVPINGLTGFDTLTPYIAEAEIKVVKEMLGDALYTQVDAINDDGTEANKELLMLVRSAVANLTMYYGFDMLNVQFSDTGFTRSSGENSLYKYQEDNLKNSFVNKAFDFIDKALAYLYANLASFGSFKTSTWYVKGSFFKTTAEFSAIYPIGNSRLVFNKIAGYFDRVIDFEIIPAMGQPLYDLLKQEMEKESEPNADVMALVPYVKKALAFLAINRGIDELNYNITNKGLLVERQVGINNNSLELSPIDVETMNVLRRSSNTIGTSYLNQLVTYLSQNRDKYPLYLQNITSTNPYRRDNAGKKTFWA